MKGFKLFLEASEEEKNLKATLKKLPKNHAALIKGYRFKFVSGNTLDGDDEHVGLIDPERKLIILAGPWFHAREFTFIHELAHKVWEFILTPEMKKSWSKLLKSTKTDKMPKQNDEENFCHAYANYHSKHRNANFSNAQWDKFIANLDNK